MSTKRQITSLASRVRALRPPEPDSSCRRLWGGIINAITGSGLVPEAQLRDFRQMCGWEATDRILAADQLAKEQAHGHA